MLIEYMVSMYSEGEPTKACIGEQHELNSHAAGYEAIHPELKGLSPEDYPDINKLAILADVAPYSREYNIFRQKVAKEAADNTELQIEYEKILNRVKQTRDSVIRIENRRFQFSSVGMSAADMSARILGEHNNLTRSLRPAGTKNSRARRAEDVRRRQLNLLRVTR